MTAVVVAEKAGEWDWGGRAEVVMVKPFKDWNPQGTP